jgi:hypothetical protein
LAFIHKVILSNDATRGFLASDPAVLVVGIIGDGSFGRFNSDEIPSDQDVSSSNHSMFHASGVTETFPSLRGGSMDGI